MADVTVPMMIDGVEVQTGEVVYHSVISPLFAQVLYAAPGKLPKVSRYRRSLPHDTDTDALYAKIENGDLSRFRKFDALTIIKIDNRNRRLRMQDSEGREDWYKIDLIHDTQNEPTHISQGFRMFSFSEEQVIEATCAYLKKLEEHLRLKLETDVQEAQAALDEWHDDVLTDLESLRRDTPVIENTQETAFASMLADLATLEADLAKAVSE